MAKKWKKMNCGGGGAVYGMGMIGALVYFLQNAASFNEGLLGVIKAIFWPAFLIHAVLGLLGM